MSRTKRANIYYRPTNKYYRKKMYTYEEYIHYVTFDRYGIFCNPARYNIYSYKTRKNVVVMKEDINYDIIKKYYDEYVEYMNSLQRDGKNNEYMAAKKTYSKSYVKKSRAQAKNKLSRIIKNEEEWDDMVFITKPCQVGSFYADGWIFW